MSNSDLIIAIGKNDAAAVKRLLQEGAPVNEIDGSGDTPLIAAARWDKLEIVRLLVDNGADIGMKAWHGETAMACAVKNESKLVLGFLRDFMHKAVVCHQQALRNMAHQRKLKIRRVL